MQQASIFDGCNIYETKDIDSDPWKIGLPDVNGDNISAKQMFINYLQFYVEYGSCDESCLVDLLTKTFNGFYRYENKQWKDENGQILSSKRWKDENGQYVSSTDMKVKLHETVLYYYQQMEIRLKRDMSLTIKPPYIKTYYDALKKSKHGLKTTIKNVYSEFKLQNTCM